MQFSLRSLLAFMTVVALVFALGVYYVTYRVRPQQELVRRIAQLGGQVVYDYDLGPESPWRTTLAEWLGRDTFATVQGVTLTDCSDAGELRAVLESMATVGNVEVLLLDGSLLDADCVAALSRIRTLKFLSLGGRRTPPSLPSLAPLQELPALEHLSLRSQQGITPELLGELSAAPRLRVLDLVMTDVDDRGIPALRSMSELQDLWIRYSDLTPAGLSQLAGHPRLRSLDISIGQDSPALRAALPQVKIEAE